MEIAQHVTNLPPWLLFLVLIALCMVSAEAGALVAKFRLKKGIKEPEGPVGTAVGAMLGLLAFMLGFTFSITSGRFGDRKELVIRQANAIGTCYVRTSMIPEKQKQPIRKLLKEYVELLLTINYATPEEVTQSVARSEKINLQLWRHTASLTQENMDSELRTFFSASINEIMEIARERKTVSLVFRIPGTLWVSLFLLTAVSMFSIGYQIGTHGHRRILDMPLLAAAFALVVVLIADMDSTGRHRLRVSLQPLIDVQEMMKEEIP